MPERCESAHTRREGINQVELARVAAGQWGVVSVGQLDGLGIGRMLRTRWVRDGRLHRIYPGVHAVGHPALGLEGRLAAALLYAGPGAALSGVTAGSWLGLLEAKPRQLHVCTPRQCSSVQDVTVHARRRVERVWHKRLPVTPPAQTLLDIASVVRFTELRRALAEAEYLRLVTLEKVEFVLGRGKPGSAALRVAVDCHQPRLARTRRGLEEKFLLLCERHSLTPPEVNVWVAGWRVDAAWFDHRLVVELDSHLAHGTPSRLERDHQRDLDLRAAGYSVLRYTWQQLHQQPERVIAELRTLLAQQRSDQLGHLARHA